MNKELIEFLKEFSTDDRFNNFKDVLKNRTRYITVALENIFQPQNASAVLRTSDCFGVQDVHIIENENKYIINPKVALGSSKWLNLYKYDKLKNNTLSAINELKDKGYRIVATTPHKDGVSLEDFDLEKGKLALFFGTELTGLTELMKDNADEYLKIPMYGFTESFNISVSAAIILHHLTNKLRKSKINWQLPEHEQDEILLGWLKQSIKSSPGLIQEFLLNKKNI